MRLTQRAARTPAKYAGAGMGDGRSGLLPRPIAALKWGYTMLKPFPSNRLHPVPPTCGYPPSPTGTFGDARGRTPLGGHLRAYVYSYDFQTKMVIAEVSHVFHKNNQIPGQN